MHVIAHCLEVSVAAPIHDQRFVPSAEQMAKELVPPVKTRGVSPEKPFHAGHQVGARGFEHEMEMVSHQTISQDMPARFPTSLLERFQKEFAVFVREENVLAPIPAIDHMVNRAGIFDSELAGHFGSKAAEVNTQNQGEKVGTDPFTLPGGLLAGILTFSRACMRRDRRGLKGASLPGRFTSHGGSAFIVYIVRTQPKAVYRGFFKKEFHQISFQLSENGYLFNRTIGFQYVTCSFSPCP